MPRKQGTPRHSVVQKYAPGFLSSRKRNDRYWGLEPGLESLPGHSRNPFWAEMGYASDLGGTGNKAIRECRLQSEYDDAVLNTPFRYSGSSLARVLKEIEFITCR